MKNTIYKRNYGITVTPFDEMYVVFPNYTDEKNTPYLCRLNKTSFEVLESIDGNRTVTDIINIISQKYKKPFNEIEFEILEVIRQFYQHKLIF